jgi:UDP-N-acetylglucosamine acyltransferase
MPVISPKAVVLNPSGLAEDVQVGPFAFLGPEVTVGPGTLIAGGATVIGRTQIGCSCRLLPGCVIGGPPPAEPGKIPIEGGSCSIGNNNSIREHVTIETGANGPAGRMDEGTYIGNNNLLMVGCHIGHNARLEGEGIFANFTRVDHHGWIEKFVRTSGFTNVEAYATVGAYTFTTGYADVDRDAPPYAIVQGLPCRVRSVNSENLKRCGFAPDQIATIKEAFRFLFVDDGAKVDLARLDQAQKNFGSEQVGYLINSLRRSAKHPTGRAMEPV